MGESKPIQNVRGRVRAENLSTRKRTRETGSEDKAPRKIPKTQDLASSTTKMSLEIRCKLRVREAIKPITDVKETNEGSTESTFLRAETQDAVPDFKTDVSLSPSTNVHRFVMDLRQYKRRKLFVRLDQLVPLPLKIRDSDPRHIAALYESFIEQGYEPSHGLIHIAQLESRTSTVTTKFKADAFSPEFRNAAMDRVRPHPTSEDVSCIPALSILDGHHRNGALLQIMLDHAKDYSLLRRFTWIQAMEWRRKDGSALSAIEALAIGSRMNKTTKLVKNISFMDNLTVSLSFAQGFSLQNSEAPVCVKDLRESMKGAQLLSIDTSKDADATRKYNRFARPALFLCEYPRTLDTIRFLNHNNIIGITHLQSSAFLSLKDQMHINMVIEGLYVYLRAPACKELPRKGRFEPPRDNLFVKYVLGLVNEMTDVVRMRKLDLISALLSHSFILQRRSTPFTARDCFRSYAAAFRFDNEDDEANKSFSQGLAKSFRSCLDGLLENANQYACDDGFPHAVRDAAALRESFVQKPKPRSRRRRKNISRQVVRDTTLKSAESSDEYSSVDEDDEADQSTIPNISATQRKDKPPHQQRTPLKNHQQMIVTPLNIGTCVTTKPKITIHPLVKPLVPLHRVKS